MNVDFSSIIADAVKKDPALLASILAQASAPVTSAQAAPVTTAVKANAPTVTTAADGRITIDMTRDNRNARTDARIPETICTIGQTTDNQDITLGFAKKFGYGVKVGDTTIFHHKRTWDLLVLLAPLVSAAISERYEVKK
jgi:hypothetical protein